jgi:hypothetical protein
MVRDNQTDLNCPRHRRFHGRQDCCGNRHADNQHAARRSCPTKRFVQNKHAKERTHDRLKVEKDASLRGRHTRDALLPEQRCARGGEQSLGSQCRPCAEGHTNWRQAVEGSTTIDRKIVPTIMTEPVTVLGSYRCINRLLARTPDKGQE